MKEFHLSDILGPRFSLQFSSLKASGPFLEESWHFSICLKLRKILTNQKHIFLRKINLRNFEISQLKPPYTNIKIENILVLCLIIIQQICKFERIAVMFKVWFCQVGFYQVHSVNENSVKPEVWDNDPKSQWDIDP